ncbi:hypothetical protein Vretimale_27 [Volvox reticuliferus]|uniref:Cytochrome b561 domain-containing protein n=1 Tax=Volvox reticuliferus TaxID=1737510 RepID=A0A8J4D155_9CHLO|nr:hypothetical protein Vretifemale_8368 [Volvox reticuliferus]GIL93706.1 hypothetical protein Vretimale_27 [Volvox reticuliferus]
MNARPLCSRRCLRRRASQDEAGLAFLLLTVLLATVQLSVPTPTFFLDPARALINSSQKCIAHPSSNTSAKGVAKHGTPILDSNITFEIRNSGDSALAGILCPGNDYTLKVAYGGFPRAALLNSNPPLVTFTLPAPTSGCPNQVTQPTSNASTTFNTRFTVSCNATGQTLLFKVTSAGRDEGLTWRYAAMSVPVANANSSAAAPGGLCAAAIAACGLNGKMSPPPLSTASEVQHSRTTNTSTCTPSTLGYQCMAQKGKMTVHWTLNTKAAPSNLCTPASKTELTESEVAQYGTLHMAAQSTTQGYVGLGFAEDPADMYRSDILLGWLDAAGRASINTFFAQRNGIDMGDVVTDTWAYDTGVIRDSAGITTLCFSRRLVDNRAKISQDLRAAVGSSSAVGGSRRLLDATAQEAQQLGLIWARSPSPRLVQHADEDAGGFYLDLVSGVFVESVDVGKSKSYWVNVHGALMAVAWGLLLPLGTLLPAHRWLLGDTKVAGKHLWFWLHLGCQWIGMALFIAGFVVAFVQFDFSGSPDVAEAHEKIGIAVMAAAGAQVVLGFVRPSPEHARRGLWNLVHHNLGRLTILLAWANVYIGIYLAHTSWGASYTEWVTPIAIVMGLLVLLDVALRIAGCGKKDVAAPARSDAYKASDDNLAKGGAGNEGKGPSSYAVSSQISSDNTVGAHVKETPFPQSKSAV